MAHQRIFLSPLYLLSRYNTFAFAVAAYTYASSSTGTQSGVIKKFPSHHEEEKKKCWSFCRCSCQELGKKVQTLQTLFSFPISFQSLGLLTSPKQYLPTFMKESKIFVANMYCQRGGSTTESFAGRVVSSNPNRGHIRQT